MKTPGHLSLRRDVSDMALVAIALAAGAGCYAKLCLSSTEYRARSVVCQTKMLVWSRVWPMRNPIDWWTSVKINLDNQSKWLIMKFFVDAHSLIFSSVMNVWT